MQNIRAVLFDLDGTLIDSVPHQLRLMAHMLEAVGLPPAPRALVAEFMIDGLGVLEKMIPAELADRKDELIRELLAVGRPLSTEMFLHQIPLIPGVEQLLPLLADRGVALGVATSTDRRNIDKKFAPLERAGLRELFEVIVATNDAPRRKPAPDQLLEGARRLDVPPEACVYVGDAHVDIRAGRAAGMQTVGVLTGVDGAATLRREHPTLLLDSVAELCPLFAPEPAAAIGKARGETEDRPCN